MSEIQEMRDAIARIEDKYREPLLLRLVGGFSCDEIAEQLGITASAVMTQLFRARAKLKALLRGAGGHFCAGADLKDMATARMLLADNPNALVDTNAAFGELCAPGRCRRPRLRPRRSRRS